MKPSQSNSAPVLSIGLVGLDTSHVTAFASILNDKESNHHIPGARIACGFPGGAADFPLSATRVEGFTRELVDRYGITLADSPRAVAEQVDAIIITAADGRQHRELFCEVAGLGKPVFIDKPLATSSEDARAIAARAEETNTAFFSASSLRFVEVLHDSLKMPAVSNCLGIDVTGPMPIEKTQGRFFWYGIHSVEAVYAALGRGCQRVWATGSGEHDLIVGRWQDGRLGVIRGFRGDNQYFHAAIHVDGGCHNASLLDGSRPIYCGLLSEVLKFFQTGISPVSSAEMIEVIRFLECADESAASGEPVIL